MINYIFDFDSTLCACEVLKEALSLSDCSEKDQKKLDKITSDGMEGKISFRESINKRLELTKLTPEIIEETSEKVLGMSLAAFPAYIGPFREQGHNVIIVSGCPRQLIQKSYRYLQFKDEEVYCLEFDDNLQIKDSILLEDHGKSKLIKSLNLQGPKVMIGDGINDLDTYLEGAVDEFICFTGVINREAVSVKSHNIACSLSHLFNYYLNKGESLFTNVIK